jgi:uncharacterized LabA/DUF88 family protein
MKYPKKRVMFCIDGFNLYYGALRDQPYRWVDLEALCGCYIKPGFELVGVKYFTAKLKDRPENPGQRERQRQYLRAVKTLPIVSTYYGQFLMRTAVRQLEKLPRRHRRGDIGLRSVWIHEEKGSDVNLATHLIADGFRARYDLAVVISNDSDLKMPVDFVRSEFNPVGVINPHADRRRSFALSPHQIPEGSFYQRLKAGKLRRCQLPLELHDDEGTICCPDGWCRPFKSQEPPEGGSASQATAKQPEGVQPP